MWISDSYESIFAQAAKKQEKGDYTGALETFQHLDERLSNLKPNLIQRRPELKRLLMLSLWRQADIHHWQGDFDQSLDLLRRLSELAPEMKSQWNQATALVQIDKGQFEEGLDILTAEAVASPGNSDLWLLIGMENEALSRLDEAEANLKRSTVNAGNAEAKTKAYLALFDFYRNREKIQEALEAWDQAWAHAKDGQPAYIFPLYQMMWEMGRLEEAQRYLGRERNPLRKGFYQGWIDLEQGNHDQAVRKWERVVKMDPLKYDEGQEAWAEAALRTDTSPQLVSNVLSALERAGAATSRGLILHAVAEARLGKTENVIQILKTARNIGLRTRPRRVGLSPANWELFDQLVPDVDTKDQVRQYFESASQTEESAP